MIEKTEDAPCPTLVAPAEIHQSIDLSQGFRWISAPDFRARKFTIFSIISACRFHLYSVTVFATYSYPILSYDSSASVYAANISRVSYQFPILLHVPESVIKQLLDMAGELSI